MVTETNNAEFESACGGRIKEPSKYPSAEYEGRQVYFCTAACLRAFKAAPDNFMAGEIEHPLDED